VGRSGGPLRFHFVTYSLIFLITLRNVTENFFKVMILSRIFQPCAIYSIFHGVSSIFIFSMLSLFTLVLLDLFFSWRFKVAAHKKVLHRGVAATLHLMDHEIWLKKSHYRTNPYSLYWNKPNSWVDDIRVTCSKGYRWHGREISDLAPDYRVLVLGGSTTFSNQCFQDYRETWCYRLEEILIMANPNLRIEVINAGLNYGMTTELVSHFVFRAQHLNPDLVILHGPGNDSLPAALGDISTDYSHTRDFVFHTKRPKEKFFLSKSGLLRCIYSVWLNSPHYAKLEPPKFPDNEVQENNLNANTGQTFVNNLSTIIDLCTARRIDFLYFPFVYASMSRMKQFHGGLAQSIYNFEEKLNIRAEHTIKQYKKAKVQFLDCEQLSLTDDDFYDSCHLNQSGELKKALLVSRKVQAILEANK
jgi:hypothetical protein